MIMLLILTRPAYAHVCTRLSMTSQGQGRPITWTERVYGKQQTTYFHQMERFVTDLEVLEGKSSAR